MGEYTYVVKPCLSEKTFAITEKELIGAISPLYYAFLKTIGNYTFGMDDAQNDKENADPSIPQP